MPKTAYTEIAEIDILPGNLVHVTMNKGAEVDFDSANQLIRTIESQLEKDNICKGMLVDLSGLTYIQAEARDYLSSGADVSGVSAGIALVSDSFLGKTIGKMFITMSEIRKNYPIEYFDSPMRAEHWIRTRMKDIEDKINFQKSVA